MVNTLGPEIRRDRKMPTASTRSADRRYHGRCRRGRLGLGCSSSDSPLASSDGGAMRESVRQDTRRGATSQQLCLRHGFGTCRLCPRRPPLARAPRLHDDQHVHQHAFELAFRRGGGIAVQAAGSDIVRRSAVVIRRATVVIR